MESWVMDTGHCEGLCFNLSEWGNHLKQKSYLNSCILKNLPFLLRIGCRK